MERLDEIVSPLRELKYRLEMRLHHGEELHKVGDLLEGEVRLEKLRFALQAVENEIVRRDACEMQRTAPMVKALEECQRFFDSLRAADAYSYASTLCEQALREINERN